MDAAQLLTLWETGRSAMPAERTLLLLAAAHEDVSDDELLNFTLGRKERALLSLRAELFGNTMESVAECPNCEERLEFTLDTDQLGWDDPAPMPESVDLQVEDIAVRVRPLILDDFLTAEGDGRLLFERAIVWAQRGGSAVPPDELSPALIEAIADRLLELDPMMQISFRLDCPACDAVWTAPFDILSFLWTEIEQWVQQILQTVHVLASSYGWSEEEILTMSAWRRQSYLELIQS